MHLNGLTDRRTHALRSLGIDDVGPRRPHLDQGAPHLIRHRPRDVGAHDDDGGVLPGLHDGAVGAEAHRHGRLHDEAVKIVQVALALADAVSLFLAWAGDASGQQSRSQHGHEC
jgi:hypothetical protein